MHKYLFLDRDGVINVENENGYILSIADFHFETGVLDAFQILKPHFEKIFIVTNQRCIGKGLITSNTLDEIHTYMRQGLIDIGIEIDHIYYAPALNSDDWYRKPNIGMAVQAQLDFPDLNFKESIMIGNNLSDMEFGKRVGMSTCLLHTTGTKVPLSHHLVDMQFTNLLAFAQSL